MEGSWQVFQLLEAFADGMGGWRVMDVLGKSVGELPETLADDLLTWRMLRGRMMKIKDREEQALKGQSDGDGL